MQEYFFEERSSNLSSPYLEVECKKHQILDEELNEGNHTWERLGTKLNAKKLQRIVENLSSKIKIVKECKSKILEESNRLLVKIQNLCRQALDMIYEKQKNYETLLRICETILPDNYIQEIQMQSKTSLVIHMPNYDFKEIEKFYSSNFLEVYENVKYIPSMPANDSKDLLEKDYGLFIEGHTGWISSIAITTDNKYIVSGGYDKTVRIWSLKDRTQEAILQNHTASVSSVKITSNNKYIISGSFDKTVRIWDLQEKTQEAVLKGHTDFVNSIAVTSDSKYIVSGSRDNNLRIWDFQFKRLEAVLQGHISSVNAIAITSDNKYIASGGDDKTIRIWSLQDKRQEAVLSGHGGIVYVVAITTDSKYIVSSSKDRTIRIWNLQDKEQEHVLKGHTDYISAIVITNDNKYIISGS